MNMQKPEQIRRRAYEIWQAEGCPPGGELRHWFIPDSEFDEQHNPAGPFKGFSVLARETVAMPALSKRWRLLPQDVVITTGKSRRAGRSNARKVAPVRRRSAVAGT